jgi:hypothetical protein
MHVALGQPSSVQGISFSSVALGLVRTFNVSNGIEHSTRTIAEHSHAPPISSSLPTLPLRI